MSNPKLNRDKAYLRKDEKMYTPADENGERTLEKAYPSINSAKRRSRELMKQGQVIVTRG